jgi:hypothetical protein
MQDADKRNALLEHAKAFSNQAVTAVKVRDGLALQCQRDPVC